MDSPFDAIFAPYIEQLHPCLREQYLCPADAPYEVVVGGKMERIWHRPKWLWPVFWLLSLGNVFFPETGEDIPTHLIITPASNAQGEPIQVWKRTFFFPNQARRQYVSTMIYAPDTNRIIELQGPNNMFAEIAEIRITSLSTLEILTVESRLNFGRFQIKLPRKLWITAHVVQTVLPDRQDTSHVELTITNSLLGPIFGYDGTFRTIRRPRNQDIG